MDKELDLKFFEAACKGDLAGAKEALQEGANVNYANGDGRTALMRSAKRGYEDIVDLLLVSGADVRARDNNNKTALMGAAKKGYLKIVKTLVDAGADVNSHDNN